MDTFFKYSLLLSNHMLNNWSCSSVWKTGAVPRAPESTKKDLGGMGRQSCMSLLNAETLPWEEEDSMQVGKSHRKGSLPMLGKPNSASGLLDTP